MGRGTSQVRAKGSGHPTTEWESHWSREERRRPRSNPSSPYIKHEQAREVSRWIKAMATRLTTEFSSWSQQGTR